MKNHFLKLATSLAFCLSLNAQATDILVPAYFYPSSDPNSSFWDEMTVAASQGVGITAIMNPNSGPSTAVNSDYTAAINAFRAAGGTVIGYVSTAYGARDASAVLADVNAYQNFYQIDGIFLDEMHNTADKLSYYQTLRADIAGINASYKVVGNAGTNTLEGYMNTADVLVTFENQTGYSTYTPDSWTSNYSANRFAHLLYNVNNASDMQANLALAASRNVGYLYITDDNGANPWDTLPSYWHAEVTAVSAVPEPETYGMMLLGLGLVAFQYQRRKHQP